MEKKSKAIPLQIMKFIKQVTRIEKKANYAERGYTDIKEKFYKYLYHHKNQRDIFDVLQELVEGYNEGYHSWNDEYQYIQMVYYLAGVGGTQVYSYR